MDPESEYNNRARVPEHPALIEGWARAAAAYRAERGATAELALAYGPGERERLDLFWPESGPGSAVPMALFLHGGYWQALDRAWVSHCARGLNAQGVAVAMPSTDLCPAVPLARIVAQARAAAAFLHRRHGRRLLASGHSAGGHLAAMLLATDWRRAVDPALPADLVPAGLPVSGLFELAPLLPTSIARTLALDAGTARALSPRVLPPPPAGVRLHAFTQPYLSRSATN